MQMWVRMYGNMCVRVGTRACLPAHPTAEDIAWVPPLYASVESVSYLDIAWPRSCR